MVNVIYQRLRMVCYELKLLNVLIRVHRLPSTLSRKLTYRVHQSLLL